MNSNNLTDRFLLQLFYSEIINNLTQLSSFFQELIDKTKTYYVQMRFCYVQILTNLFVHFLTLISVCQILIYIYYTLKSESASKNRLNSKLFTVFPLHLAFFLSYIVWMLQIQIFQSNTRGKFVRIISCTVTSILDLSIYVMFGILFIISVCFLIKIIYYLNSLKPNIMTKSRDSNICEVSPTYKAAMMLQKKLKIYPIVIFVIYFLQMIGRIIYYYKLHQKINYVYNCLLISIRGFFFVLCIFLTQDNLRSGFVKLLTCKKSKQLDVKSIDPDCNIQPLTDLSDDESETFANN